jgi:cytochrome c oxidase assembly protein subunit 15
MDKIGIEFLIHRSFSWLVLFLLGWMFWKNERTQKYAIIRWTFIILALELVSGVLLAYVDMPGLVRTSHLIFASVLFGILLYTGFKVKKNPA